MTTQTDELQLAWWAKNLDELDREIERRLAAGELLAVVATDALELGIDVGDLDAAICVTFPGTVACDPCSATASYQA